jgi:ribosomal protein S18 acetylase RimI-like enzyme
VTVSDFSIRSAQLGELPRIAELAGQLVRLHHAADPERFFITDRVEEGYAWWFERELARKEAALIVAAGSGGIAGYAYGTLEERDWNRLLDAHGAIHDVFVAADVRRAGIGKKLLEAMVQELTHRGARRIVLSTMVTNLAAQRLFEMCGFRPTMLEMTRSG